MILQIIPANGIDARFRNEDGNEFLCTVSCWALVERGDQRLVVGMAITSISASLELVDTNDDVDGYRFVEYIESEPRAAPRETDSPGDLYHTIPIPWNMYGDLHA